MERTHPLSAHRRFSSTYLGLMPNGLERTGRWKQHQAKTGRTREINGDRPGSYTIGESKTAPFLHLYYPSPSPSTSSCQFSFRLALRCPLSLNESSSPSPLIPSSSLLLLLLLHHLFIFVVPFSFLKDV